MHDTHDPGRALAPLPAGTRIGPWLLVGWHHQGAYGAVYQAVRAKSPRQPSVALKLALFPNDPRFAREVELLSRLRHPCVPRLIDHGHWRHPSGPIYPYLTMQWVEGTSLYDWVRARAPSSRQVLQLLAQLARALQAIHAAHGVHRDVKGGNILVRPSDDRPFLTDFGSGIYQGAERLTWRSMPPATLPYRPPEASRFAYRFILEPESHYVAQPSDDLFSLGVTAYRLLTGAYPPTQLPSAEALAWNPEDAGPWSLQVLNPRVTPQLNALVLRMLSIQPEARGTAKELAESLELAAARSDTTADLPLFDAPPALPEMAQSPVRPKSPARSTVRAPLSTWIPRCAALAGGLLLLLWLGQSLSERQPASSQQRRAGGDASVRDAGSVAVGDSALTAPSASTAAPPSSATIALELPPKPLPGQNKPDANGRCARRGQIAINGGCWIEQFALDSEACNDNTDTSYIYKGRCYAPAFPPRRQPTSTQSPNASP
ncbi:serine/threonine protein kinase [Stigmatella aurantiaca]|uniref:non-specific serine/threonine protein kinase n=1 Tax=Stigmatella aurantiaca (strain DW4/3-1) TaxID=378806 RepID=Q090I4_STIAD|nr:serine/threonine-protein kinase [Stigmatella aurantiaca]ADO70791.1 Protein kinase [Stigmatella aurantiaca DW4/3-1]EAU66153.1 protein kinase [Stigmatella aurantiaca DW4/3-1]